MHTDTDGVNRTLYCSLSQHFSVGTQVWGPRNPLLLGEISRLANDYTEVVHQNEEKMEINMDKNEAMMNVSRTGFSVMFSMS